MVGLEGYDALADTNIKPADAIVTNLPNVVLRNVLFILYTLSICFLIEFKFKVQCTD